MKMVMLQMVQFSVDETCQKRGFSFAISVETGKVVDCSGGILLQSLQIK